MVGIKNNAPGTIFGSVWINELRMTGVKRKKGTAFTTNFKFNLGELFNIDLDFKSEEADFHRLEQRLGSGDHSINYSVNLNNFKKIIPCGIKNKGLVYISQLKEINKNKFIKILIKNFMFFSA